MFSETFYTYIIATGSTLCAAMLAACYKSKCRNIDCWGLHIERDVEDETRIDTLKNTSSDKV